MPTTTTPLVIEFDSKADPQGYRATWFDTHTGGQVQGELGGTHQEALRTLADALDKEAERRGVIAAIDATP